ncbi:unnamed protein product [Fraxinus pennsylvanica]|uniref:Uncharacterized protein n=1 Tax=Fraxinus pennsylvanica TaxID=56036 RepID=A0AAD1YPX4_9LAMI|nr:unnamed protein product [Fraxinus pennsylvanica]
MHSHTISSKEKTQSHGYFIGCNDGVPSCNAARFASLALHRGLASGADHHWHAKVDCWKDPMGPSKWKEEHFMIVSLSGWGLLILGGYKFFTGGKKNNEEKLVEATH